MYGELVDQASERVVLAGILQYGKDAYVDVSDLIDSKTFSINENQILYKVFEHALQESNKLDIPTIISTCTTLGVYDIIAKKKEDLEYLRALINTPIHLENVRKHAKKLGKLEFAKKSRALLKQAYDDLGKVTGDETIDAILAISENANFELVKELNSGTENKPEQLAQDGEAMIQNVIDNPKETIGMSTPFPLFNDAIGGLRRRGVTLIGGYAKSGKSSIGKEISLHIAEKLDVPVLILDTEMDRADQFWRSIASLSGVPMKELETGKFARNQDKINKVKQANKLLEKLKIQHISVSGKEFEEILSIIRRWILREVGYDGNGNMRDCLVVYDYFKLMNPSALNIMKEYEALGYQISKLADFTKEYDFTCLAFVQLNREMGIAQSDRLKWLCTSYSSFTAKTTEEIIEDTREAGNRKLKVELGRFGPAQDDDDYIFMNLQGEINKLAELGTKRTGLIKNDEHPTGFDVKEAED